MFVMVARVFGGVLLSVVNVYVLWSVCVWKVFVGVMHVSVW